MSYKPERGSALDFNLCKGKEIQIELYGGRNVNGILRGYDTLNNLVIDQCIENFESGKSRNLGYVVIRGNQISSVCSVSGMTEIQNPFI